MAPLPWLRVFEEMAVNQLLRTPAFHRAVEAVVKRAHRVRYGVPPEEMGGTQIDQPDSQFGKHFLHELKSQLGTAEKKQISDIEQGIRKAAMEDTNKTASSHTEGSADAAWEEIQRQAGGVQKQGFMSDYADALRGQVGQKKS